MSINLAGLSEKELLSLTSKIVDELKIRKIVRTNNNPIGDYAEWLITKTLNLELAPSSSKSMDAHDTISGKRYQIKSRSVANLNRKTQLSAIRHLDERGFDYLIAIFFNRSFDVQLCISLTWEKVCELAYYHQESTNAKVLTIKPFELIGTPDVEDLTHLFRNNP